MKRILKAFSAAAVIAALLITAACSKGGGGLVGVWGMADNPQKTVKITKEGEQYFYEGSQGRTPGTLKDENTLVVPMGPIEVTATLDPASGIMSVKFMGENYQYKKVQ